MHDVSESEEGGLRGEDKEGGNTASHKFAIHTSYHIAYITRASSLPIHLGAQAREFRHQLLHLPHVLERTIEFALELSGASLRPGRLSLLRLQCRL